MRSMVAPAPYRTPALAWAAAGTALLLLAAWPVFPRSVDLRSVCTPSSQGRFGAFCSLEDIGSRPGLSWTRASVRVLEDGIPLRDVTDPREVRKAGLGTFVADSGALWFSSIDGSSPATNGKNYELVQPVIRAPLMGSFGAVMAALGAALCLALAARSSALTALVGVLVVFAACLGLQVFDALTSAPIHVDSGSSLPTARDVAAGAVPYRDILFNYTPLGVMTLAAWRAIGPVRPIAMHTWCLTLVLILELGCAFQVFRICETLGARRRLALVASLSYLSMFVYFDGSRILLEPLYLLVVLASCRTLLRATDEASAFKAGGLASVALLVKQYGGFAFWGALFSSAASSRPLRAAMRVILGSFVVLLVLSLLLFAIGVDLRNVVKETAGTDYPVRRESVWIGLYFSMAPFLLLAPALLAKSEWRRSRGVVVLGAFLLASWLPLLVRQHQYYLQNPSPFLFAAFATLVSFVIASGPRARAAWVEGLAILCFAAIPIQAARTERATPSTRGVQERRALLMTSFWPAGERVMMFAAPSFMALTDYRTSNPKVLGYRFLNESSNEQLRAGMEQASAAWVDPTSMNARTDFAREGSSLQQELTSHGFVFQMKLEDRFELWTKNGAPPRRAVPRDDDPSS